MREHDPILWQMLLQLALIALNAVFACAEIAVISVNDAKMGKLAASGNKRAKRLLSLTDKPAKFLATIQVGITFAGFLGSAFAADNFSKRLSGWIIGLGVNLPYSTLNAVSVVSITIILSYFTLVLGELLPKRIAMRKAEAIGLAMSGVILAVSKVFAPLVWLLTASTNSLLRLCRIDPNAEDEEVTEEEIRMMVDVGSEKGSIDRDEQEFIHNVFELDNKTAAEIMTHRTDVTFIWIDDTDESWEETIYNSRYSVYPICGEDTDDIVGVLNVRDYFRLKSRDRESVMEKAVKPAQFVPETVRADTLLANMKKHRNHFAVVIDEYGGMSGVVTMSDLLEELVGDLEDDNSAPAEAPEIESVGGGWWRVSGAAPLGEVAAAIGVSLPCVEYDTFAGMALSQLGSIPADGETPEIEAYGLTIHVEEIRERRLERALVTKTESAVPL